MNSNMALEIRNLSYRISGKNILRDISFSVASGEFVSVVGPNGAGKTTMLKCLNRIISGATGEIFVHARPLPDYSQAELAVQLGYVPQGGAENVAFTVFEFVMMGRYPHLSAFISPTTKDEQVVGNALEMAGAAALQDRECATLSGGERQRVLIAAALAQDARILLLDEPTTFLDPHHQHDILRLLTTLNRDVGITILAVTHDINAAALTSSRILALKNGGKAFDGNTDSFMDNSILNSVFDHSFHFINHPATGQRLVVPEAVR